MMREVDYNSLTKAGGMAMDTPKSDQTEQAAPTGINWLTVFGLIVLILLICVVIVAIWIGRQGMRNPIVQSAMRLEPAIEQMKDMTQSQIEQQAAALPAAALGKDPYGFDDRFVVVEGTVSKEESIHVEQNMARNIFSETNYRAYILDEAVVVIDITGEGPDVSDGALIKGFGKVFVVNVKDIWELPVVGPNLEQEFGNVEGMADKVIFLISKGVQVVEEPEIMLEGEADVVEMPTDGEEGSALEATEVVPGEDVAEPPADDGEGEPAEDEEAPEEPQAA
jgi:hypothetical protein